MHQHPSAAGVAVVLWRATAMPFARTKGYSVISGNKGGSDTNTNHRITLRQLLCNCSSEYTSTVITTHHQIIERQLLCNYESLIDYSGARLITKTI